MPGKSTPEAIRPFSLNHDDQKGKDSFYQAKWKHAIYQKFVRRLEYAQQGAMKRQNVGQPQNYGQPTNLMSNYLPAN